MGARCGADSAGNGVFNMIYWWDYWIGGDSESLSGNGSISTLPVEEARDYGAELRAVVEEVTMRPCKEPIKPGIGFY
jgi:hypothetical protein